MIESGTVTVRATANDDSGVYGEAEIEIVDWHIAVSARGNATELASKKTLQMSAAYVPASMTAGAFRWSVRAEDAAYASVSGTGLVTAKTITDGQKHDVVITATSTQAGPAAGTYTLTILPLATGAAIEAGGTTVTNQTLPLDLYSATTLQLSALFSPTDAMQDATWSTSNALVATVNSAGLVTGVKPGVATIKATAKDGSGKYASVKVQVLYLDAAAKLTAGSENPAIPTRGLETGNTTDMTVFGTDKTAALDINLFTYSVPSTQASIASVDASGRITAGTKAGTATVTAALIGDPLKRAATLTIKVIPIQTDSVLLTPTLAETAPYELVMYDENGDETNDAESAARYAILLDKADLGTGATSYSFTLTPSATDTNGNDMPSPQLTYQSSDTSIATVAESSGVVKVSVKRGSTVTGACTITGVSKDLAKAAGYLSIYVRDYAPRLGASSLTLNPKRTTGISTPLLSSYGNGFTEADIELYEYNAATRAYANTVSARLIPTYANDMLTVTSVGAIANGTIKTLLKIACENGVTYELPLTIAIKNATVAITIKQASKFNLFYTDSETLLTVTAADATITNIALKAMANETFASEYGDDGRTLTLRYADTPAFTATKLPYAKVTLVITAEGYADPIEKVCTISTITTKPSLSLTPASSVINTARGEQSTTFTVYDKTNKRTLDLDNVATSTGAFAALDADLDTDMLTLTLTGTSGGTAGILIQNSNWMQAIKLSHTVVVQRSLPTAKLAATTLTLNNVFTETTASTALTLSQVNQTIDTVTFTPTAAAGTAARLESDKLELTYANGKVTAAIAAGETPKAGAYSFKVQAKLDASTPLASVTRKVTVTSTVPKVSLASAALKLNSAFALEESAATGFKLSLKGYALTDVTVVKASGNPLDGGDISLNDDILFAFDAENAVLTARLGEELANGTYAYVVTPTVKDLITNQTKALTPSTLKVTVYRSTAVSATVTASGKPDTINRGGSAIIYTLTKLTNIIGTAESVALAGADADKFTVSLDDAPNAKGQQTVTLKLKEDGTYSTAATYKIQLLFNLAGITAPITTPILSVKVTQSALKLTAAPTAAAAYQSQAAETKLRYTLTLTSPTGAKIGSIALNAATTADLRRALGINGAIETTIAADGRSAAIDVSFKDTSKIKVGATYTVLLDVTPVGNASNAKNTQVKVTVKVYR